MGQGDPGCGHPAIAGAALVRKDQSADEIGPFGLSPRDTEFLRLQASVEVCPSRCQSTMMTHFITEWGYSVKSEKLSTLAAAALLAVSIAGLSGEAHADTISQVPFSTGSLTWPGNDCSGLFGQGFTNCAYNGSPIIGKFNFDNGVPGLVELNTSLFTGLQASWFTIDPIAKTWKYDPQGAGPARGRASAPPRHRRPHVAGGSHPAPGQHHGQRRVGRTGGPDHVMARLPGPLQRRSGGGWEPRRPTKAESRKQKAEIQ